MRQVDEQHVKQQLRQQQQAWEAEQEAGGDSTPASLAFWSVGKLLRVLQASKSAPKPLESLEKLGITRYSVGSRNQRLTSQPTTADTQDVPTTDAVSYSSNHIWLTGFLHFGEELDTCDTFYLSDSNSKLPSFLRDPSPQLTDQLVLVKRWVLVDKAFGGVRTAGSVFLEIHDEKPVPLLPVNDLYADWTREDALEVLQAHYQTVDPPMYTGTEPWEALSRKGSAENGHVHSVLNDEKAAEGGTGKHRKRKRVHAVFGRVASVSPISRQKDHASSHFFVEIEHHERSGAILSVASVMFTGVSSMRWHLFLRPGKIVLLTDLVKVFSRECEMFLLQTTNGHQSKVQVNCTEEPLHTTVLVWEDVVSPQTDIERLISDSKEVFSNAFASRCCGKLLDFEGQVCRLLWDECIELQGPDEVRVIVCLFRFPYEHELVRLRKGATVKIHDAHILRWPTPVGGKLVVGLCPRGYLAITDFGEPSGPCLLTGSRSRRGRAHKKWSCMGDFRHQSLVLSMWLLEVLEQLDTKLKFEEGEVGVNGSAMLSFSGLRRREAAVHVAKKLGAIPHGAYERTAITLGTLFLKCHADGAAKCITLQQPSLEKTQMFSRVVSISELEAFGRSKLNNLITTTTEASDDPVSVRIPADNFDWCQLSGCIRGNIDSGDLEVFDCTGSIPLRLKGGGASVHFEGAHGVYLFHSFDLIVENYNRIGGAYKVEKLPLAYCVSCAAADLEFVPMPLDEDISFSPEVKTLADVNAVQDLLLMVTHVDALPRSSIRSAGLLPEYRVVHGIVCPVGEGLQVNQFMNSVHTAEVLVGSECRSWFLRKGFCYRIKAAEGSQDPQNLSTSRRISVEDRAVKASRNYLEKVSDAKSTGIICFDSLNHFSYEEDSEASDEEGSFRVYRTQGKRTPIVPIKLDCDNYQTTQCEVHELCQRSHISENGMMVISASGGVLTCKMDENFHGADRVVSQTLAKVSTSELIGMSILNFFLRRSEAVSQICSLLHHPLTIQSQPIDDGSSEEDRTIMTAVDPDLHKPHLTSVVGMITKKKYHWRCNSPQQTLGHVATIGVKRGRESNNVIAGSTIADSSRRLLCILHIRDLQSLDIVEIRVDASRFGFLGTLQLNSVVEFTRLQGFIARSSYKVYLNWSHFTAARLISDTASASLPLNSELYGAMPTTFLNDLYEASHVDRRLHRYVVGVMHVSYALLKRKCGTCHRALQFVKRRGCWKHAEEQVASYSRDCASSRQHWTPSDPEFKTRTYMGATVRCIIDDGSAQAELFLENDVAWELLACTDGQRQRFEDILSNYVEELSYFSGRTANATFATSMAEREQEYYQNELRAFVLDAIPSLRSIVVFAQRFYKVKQQKEGTSVLTFGKDVHLTTKTAPQPKLEAKRVDRLHVRSELQRRLAQLRLQTTQIQA